MVDPRIGRFAGPIAAFVAMVAVVMGTAAVLFARKIGFDPDHVQAFYLGSEAAFAPPRSLAGLLEVAVPHLLAIPMLIFVTLHLVAFVNRARRRPFAAVAAITYACALAAIGAGFAIRFAWPGLAPLKIAAFVGLEGTMLAWLGLLAAAVLPRARGEARPGAVTGPEAAPPRAAG
jgi:cytochrome bd-type quinol oxidase subunit 2